MRRRGLRQAADWSCCGMASYTNPNGLATQRGWSAGLYRRDLTRDP